MAFELVAPYVGIFFVLFSILAAEVFKPAIAEHTVWMLVATAIIVVCIYWIIFRSLRIVFCRVGPWTWVAGLIPLFVPALYGIVVGGAEGNSTVVVVTTLTAVFLFAFRLCTFIAVDHIWNGQGTLIKRQLKKTAASELIEMRLKKLTPIVWTPDEFARLKKSNPPH